MYFCAKYISISEISYQVMTFLISSDNYSFVENELNQTIQHLKQASVTCQAVAVCFKTIASLLFCLDHK